MLKVEFGWDYYHTFLVIIVATIFQLGHQIAGDEIAYPVTSYPIARPGCPEKCGDVFIPYPFGIGDECHYDHPVDGQFYNITCNNNSVIPTYGDIVEVEKITVDGEIWLRNDISYVCYDSNGTVTSDFTSWLSVKRFALSTTQNIAGAIGCDAVALFGDGDDSTNISTTGGSISGCLTVCNNQTAISDDVCSGKGCCLASIPDKITNLTLIAQSIFNHTQVYSFNPCSVAFVVAKDQIQKAHLSIKSTLKQDFKYFKNKDLLYPTVYNWSIGNNTCKNALASGEYLCKGNTFCLDDLPGLLGYRCQCKPGFEGNPYLRDCQDIDECKLNSCEKPEYCNNTLGSYSCTCPKGYYGNATKDSPCLINDRSSQRNKKLLLTVKAIIGIGGGVIVSLLAGLWFNWQHNNTKLQKIRETCFRQNGGHILQQKLLGRDVSVGNNVKMFTVEQLEKATDNYSENSIIGRGGFGMVFKGTLSSKELSLNNNQVVAIKRSIKVDSTQVEQFINEVVALSQINNKNVVKLLGCCLETEVPLLVYEYISNGTLYEHLHDEGKMSSVVLSWDIRLRIAAEVADVLAYLHTTISVPIIHRDIKSANILLDENFTAKVADFGASKLVPADQEQLGTMVQGTCGYLDPEYMQTGELTDKSDVYSFGVVLVELLTREKAISYAKPETERSLAVCFLRKLKEDRLIDILDEKIVSDGAIMGQLKAVADVGRMCLKLKGEDRPTMKEVARELDGIRGMGVHPWSSNMEEETEYLLGQTRVFNHGVTDSWNSQSRVVELLPFDDGR